MKVRLAVLLGDGAGIGPEQVAKCAAEGFLTEQCEPIILGDRRIWDRALQFTGNEGYEVVSIDNFDNLSFDGKRPLFYDMKDLNPADFEMGTVNAFTGKASIDQLDLSVDLWKKGIVSAILFAPFNKASMKASKGEIYASELAYLRDILDFHGYSCEINHMRHVFTTRATSHVPLTQIGKYITKDVIQDSIRLLWKTMLDAGNKEPRIASAALNPHAGEYGTCGREEIDIIAPAVAEMNAEGIPCTGPISADTLFNRAFNLGEFDGIVTMYHDQGQIALKLLGFEEGVSIQGGLPCPITTPAHGSAFEIAVTGTCSIRAFKTALLDAVAMGGNRG